MDQPPLVCALVYDHLCTFEYGIATELFALNRPEFDKPLYRFASVAIDNTPIRAAGGLTLLPDAGLKKLTQADIIIIPGWPSATTPVPTELITALKNAHKRGTKILTICSGVFVLAATGLLHNKSATTHWRYTKILKENNPEINVQPNVLYVDEGQLLTSAGSAAGIDLCLHVIRQQYGQNIANKMARSLVLPAQREGGQAQYIPRKTYPTAQTQFEKTLDIFRRRLIENWDVTKMAKAANLSPRTMLRRFIAHSNQSPKNWLRKERLTKAADLLESTNLNIDQIAQNSGFPTPENFRLQFKNHYKISPSKYRTQFGMQR